MGPGPMLAKKTLLNCVESLYRLAQNRTSLLAASLCLAGGLFATPGAWAVESTNDTAALASTQLTSLEPGYQLPESMPSADDHVEPAQHEPASGIDLERVQDLESIVDDARKQAQVEYLARKLGKPALAVQQYVHLAWAEARRRTGLSPELLIAIMHRESTFQPKVQSSYGAQGLMQVVRRWHREKLRASESLFDPEVNVRVGADILEEYLELVGGDLSKALAKYSGNTRGYAKTVIGESRKLAQVADLAAAEVATASWLTEEASAEYAG